MLADFALMFCAQSLNYLVLAFNFRAISEGHLAWAFWTDLVVGFVGFMVIKRIADVDKQGHPRMALAGYMLGGACGTVIAIEASTFLI